MSDDLKTNYTKLNKRYQELKQQLAEKDAEIRVAYSFRKQKCDNLQKALAEKEEILHNRDKWIAELERQVNLSRAMERVALKGCKELEEKLKEVEGQYAYECECNKQFVECQNENEKLKNQLALTEKALELACETLQDINFKLYNTEMNFVDFFKQQAKEMLENE